MEMAYVYLVTSVNDPGFHVVGFFFSRKFRKSMENDFFIVVWVLISESRMALKMTTCTPEILFCRMKLEISLLTLFM